MWGFLSPVPAAPSSFALTCHESSERTRAYTHWQGSLRQKQDARKYSDGSRRLRNPRMGRGTRVVLTRILAVLGVGVWCILILLMSVAFVIDRGLANVGIVWLAVFGIGVVAPILLLGQINRTIAAHEASRRAPTNTKEKELLGALEEHGRLTPATAAMRTSLTVDEASEMLEELVRKGHLEAGTDQGTVAYALVGRDRLQGLPRVPRRATGRQRCITLARRPFERARARGAGPPRFGQDQFRGGRGSLRFRRYRQEPHRQHLPQARRKEPSRRPQQGALARADSVTFSSSL